ncbi:SpoU_sub_bind domain-containing protein [Haematococcus lacustris]|uniref:SpoU_sub_bind domain-containing protein n=1 Tax=Haematococcus lacustris TaxID=44745 RepID=A0A699Z2U2_HAELA|nr:SpoU_sub_bind domain-containing protein [Haematococcus lacustris]
MASRDVDCALACLALQRYMCGHLLRVADVYDEKENTSTYTSMAVLWLSMMAVGFKTWSAHAGARSVKQRSLACLAQRKRQAAAAPVGAPSRIASEASDARKHDPPSERGLQRSRERGTAGDRSGKKSEPRSYFERRENGSSSGGTGWRDTKPPSQQERWARSQAFQAVQTDRMPSRTHQRVQPDAEQASEGRSRHSYTQEQRGAGNAFAANQGTVPQQERSRKQQWPGQRGDAPDIEDEAEYGGRDEEEGGYEPGTGQWGRRDEPGHRGMARHDDYAGNGVVQADLEGEAVFGVFPVLNALRARRRPALHALYVLASLDMSQRKDAAALRDLFAAAKEAAVPLRKVSRHELNLLCGDRLHQVSAMHAMRPRNNPNSQACC